MGVRLHTALQRASNIRLENCRSPLAERPRRSIFGQRT
jgi:hypothetical protein